MERLRTIFWLGALVGLFGCDDGGGADGQPADAAPDATSDGAVLDGGSRDGASRDMRPAADGAIDSAVDASPLADLGGDQGPDRGVSPEAGPPPDVGRPDRGVLDQGVVVDAAPDAEPEELCDGRPIVDEACNGVDDDCDGAIDEGFGLAERCEGVGRCGVGFIECGEAGAVRCSTDPGGSTTQARMERCNGLDDDCDGEADESPDAFSEACYEGPPGTAGVGRCREGARRCEDGAFGACAGQVVPRAEICDGEDDDCDGEVDEGLEAAARCGEGVCRETATPGRCVDGVEVGCQPGPPTGDDSDCDGLDDDCDGEVDELYVGQQACGMGLCAERATPGRCEAGREIPCQPGLAAPNDISCDGVDEDCDGRADEGFQSARCGIGVCRTNARPSACVDAVEVACVPGEPTGDDTDCDGVDDDCDGRADEGYVPSAECGQGVCARDPTPSACVGGVEVPCRPGRPIGEDLNCNGVDEDCDGDTDEGYVVDVNCGVGVCAETATASSCVDGVEIPCTPGAPPVEVDDNCDGRDDDCNGVIDDAVARLLGGEQRVTAHQAGAIQPSLDRSGETYGLVWVDNRAAGVDLYYQRFDGAGARVGEAVPLELIGGSRFRPSIAADGAGGFGMVWHNTRTGRAQVHFARIDEAGQILVPDRRLVITQANASNPRIVFNGVEFGVVWADQRDLVDQIWFQRLSLVGEPIGEAQAVTRGDDPATVPSLAHRGPGDGWMVTYNRSREGDFDVFTQLLAADGTPLGDARQITAGEGNSNAPIITRRRGGFGLTWYDTRHANTEIYFALLAPDGSRVGEEIRVSNDLRPSFLPTVVSTPTGFGIAWSDRRTGNDEIWFRHLDAAGQPVGQPEQISDGQGVSFAPSMVHADGVFSIAWYDGRHGEEEEIYFARGPLGCGPQ